MKPPPATGPPEPPRPPSSPEGAGDAADFHALVEETRGPQPWRRIFHAACGLVFAAGLAWDGIGPSRLAWFLGGILLLLLTLDLVRLRTRRANVLFFRLFRALASPREAGGLASSTWYVAGVLLTLVLFPPGPALAGILVLALADPAASYVGRRWGRRPLGDGTVEGSVVFAAVATLVCLPLAGIGAAVAAALVAALVERVPALPDDNLTIPVVAGGTVWLVAFGIGG